MRNLFILTVLVLATTAAHSESGTTETVVSDNDTTVSVIAWFNKCDTLIYRIHESNWRIHENDTLKSAGISTNVMLTVTDSTSEGYTMEYEFLDFQGDSLADSELGSIQNRMAEALGQKIIGTKIKFHTDEYGSITGYDNLKQIKKQAKSLFKDASKIFMAQPLADSLKSVGIDLASYFKKVDTDQLVQGYVKELEMLFLCHGNIYDIGENSVHEDETDTQYASDTYNTVSIDPETQTYTITCQVESKIPQAALKAIVGAIVDDLSDAKIAKNFNETFDAQVEDGNITTYFGISYFPDGWPSEIIDQTTTSIGSISKVKQTYITWEYKSTGHQN